MGQWKEVRSIRFGAEDLRRVEELRDCFAPMWEGFSEVVLGALKMLHSQVVTPEILTALGDALQRLQCNTQSSHLSEGKPGPLRVTRPTHQHGRPGLVSHQFTSASVGLGLHCQMGRNSHRSPSFQAQYALVRSIA